MIHLLSILTLAVILLMGALLLAVMTASGPPPTESRPAPPPADYTFSNGMRLPCQQLVAEYEQTGGAGQYTAARRLALRVNQAGMTPRPPEAVTVREAQQEHKDCRPRTA